MLTARRISVNWKRLFEVGVIFVIQSLKQVIKTKLWTTLNFIAKFLECLKKIFYCAFASY